MASLVLKGLVLRAADYQESSRILTVLTDSRGKITVSAKGALRRSSRIAAASQPFAYAEMTLSESRDRYYLNEASTISLFPGLAADVEAYALGAYFLELLDAACPEGEETAAGELALADCGQVYLLYTPERTEQARQLRAAIAERMRRS